MNFLPKWILESGQLPKTCKINYVIVWVLQNEGDEYNDKFQ